MKKWIVFFLCMICSVYGTIPEPYRSIVDLPYVRKAVEICAEEKSLTVHSSGNFWWYTSNKDAR